MNFTSAFGPCQIDEDSSPFEIFSNFFDNDILNLLVDDTNRYFENYVARVGGLETLKPKARARLWKNVDIPEMKAFIAILL